MLFVEDLNLNSMQGCTNSLKEVLKRTMLSQDVIFRKQVHELHRLYRIQKTLMEDPGCKELDEYYLWRTSTQPTLWSFPNQVLAKERRFSRSPMVGLTQSVKHFLGEDLNDYPALQQRPFDLQLPADQHFNHVTKELLEKGNSWDLGGFLELKHQFHDNNVSSLEEVKLTLSIEGHTREKSRGKRTSYDKIAHSSSHHVIDLEESGDTVSNKVFKSVSTFSCAPPITGDEHVIRVPVQSNLSGNSVKEELSHGFKVSYSLVDGNESCERQSSFNQGYKQERGDIDYNDMFTEGKTFASYKVIGFDLNRIEPDDSSRLNDQMVAGVSTAGSSRASDGLTRNFCENECPTATSPIKPNVDCFNMPSSGNSNLADLENNSSSNIWSSSPAFKGISGSEACPIDPESVSRALSDICEHLSSDSRHSGSGNLDILKFQKENCANVTTAEVTDTHEENTVCSHRCKDGNRVEDSDSNKSPSSCKFDWIADDSSSVTKTVQSGTDLGGLNIPLKQSRRSLSSQLAETQSGEQDLRSSDSSELKHQGYNEKKEETAGGDVLIQVAAESLIHISLGSSTGNQDFCTKGGLIEIEYERSHDQPQHSLDSYESVVLKLKESTVDDYCVSSKPFDLNELDDDKDSAIKLRRGRRLKDFQRDILPGLASLSRHEIREDINIMEAVIRSREYKRMRSKMGDGGNWFAPMKSRRSKLNLVGRRHYS